MEKSILDKVSLQGNVSDAFKEEDIAKTGTPATTSDVITGEKKTEEQIIESIRADRLLEKRKRNYLKIKNTVSNIFNPDTYANFIQKFENLLLVIFIDSFYMGILLSLVYSLYIIYNFDSYDKITAISKFIGSCIISLICILVQINIHKTK